MERRSLPAELASVRVIEARVGSEPPAPVIVGYFARYYDPADQGTQYQLYDDLVERIMPGAFDRALKEDDCRALYNHNPDHLLGRCKAGTVTLSTDARGGMYQIKPPGTTLANDVMANIRAGNLTGSSFAFVPRSVKYVRPKDGSPNVRELHDVQLFDVGPVTYPAYESTSASVRAAGGNDPLREEYEAWLRGELPDQLRAAHTRYEVESRCRRLALD